MSKQSDTRKRINEFYLANRSKGKKFTFDHFKAEKIAKFTIYRIIKPTENDSGHERVRGSGRVAEIMSKKDIRRLKVIFCPKWSRLQPRYLHRTMYQEAPCPVHQSQPF